MYYIKLYLFVRPIKTVTEPLWTSYRGCYKHVRSKLRWLIMRVSFPIIYIIRRFFRLLLLYIYMFIIVYLYVCQLLYIYMLYYRGEPIGFQNKTTDLVFLIYLTSALHNNSSLLNSVCRPSHIPLQRPTEIPLNILLQSLNVNRFSSCCKPVPCIAMDDRKMRTEPL